MGNGEYMPLASLLYEAQREDVLEAEQGYDIKQDPMYLLRENINTVLQSLPFGAWPAKPVLEFTHPEFAPEGDELISWVEFSRPPFHKGNYPKGFRYLHDEIYLVVCAETEKFAWWGYRCGHNGKEQFLLAAWHEDEGAPTYAALFEFEQPLP